jgi:hypothetical protein
VDFRARVHPEKQGVETPEAPRSRFRKRTAYDADKLIAPRKDAVSTGEKEV